MKNQKKINPQDLETDLNKLLTFLDKLDVQDTDLDRLEQDIKIFESILKTKYKDYVDVEE